MSATTTNSEDDWHVDILIIGVGAEGCAAIQMEPTKELFSDKKNVHICYVAIASDVQV